MTDFHRRVIKLLKAHAPGLEAALVRESRHVTLDFSYAGATCRRSISLTPKNPDHALNRVCADVCKALNLPKIQKVNC